MGEVYGFVRSRRDLATGSGKELWQNVMLYYARLGVTHDAVRDHVAIQGRDLAGPCWEIYGHGRADPREQEVEVFWLLR